ncbi:MAG: helix-turn-helix transcriptional regulator [Myxococcaceae bacterium]|nr:helix-turn-helix transcriptional regulator [Myxococcaceae bacterium]
MADAARSAVRPSASLVEREGPGASLGRTVRRLRVQRGLSLERLSERCGVSRAMLSQIESGRSMPTITVLGRVAGGLQVSVAQLLDEGRDPPVVVTRRPSSAWPSLTPGVRFRELSNDPRLQRVRWFEFALDDGAAVDVPAIAPGDSVNVVVDAGQVELAHAGENVQLGTADASALVAEQPVRLVARRASVLYVLISRPL